MSLSFFPSSPAAPSRSARFSSFAYIASRPFIARVSLSCHPLFPFVSSLSCSHTRSCGVTYHSRHVIELCVFETRLCSNANYAFFYFSYVSHSFCVLFRLLLFAPYFIKWRINTSIHDMHLRRGTYHCQAIAIGLHDKPPRSRNN